MKSKDKLIKPSSSLRIALISDDIYPASGGIARSIQTQINELVRLGHKVTLLAPRHYLEKPDNCETIVMSSTTICKCRPPRHKEDTTNQNGSCAK